MLQKLGLHEAPSRQKFKEYYCIFSFGQLGLVKVNCQGPRNHFPLDMLHVK